MSELLAMTELPTDDSLLWKALPELTLNIAQTALLCGISVRQLGYWTRQGYVSAQGQGVRRTYGLDAIRRVLAIRKSMDAGSSLRQSLRHVSGGEALADAKPDAPPGSDTVLSSPASSLTRSLIAFFAANSHTRDHAGGLAVKLGWDEEDVRTVADTLCNSGILTRTICHGMVIFYNAQREVSHA